MGGYHVQGTYDAEKRLKCNASATLTSTRDKCCVIRIQDDGELPKDAYQSTRDSGAGCKIELDFDIAETVAIPPCLEIIRGPYQGVDKIEDIVQGDPEDKDCGSHIT